MQRTKHQLEDDSSNGLHPLLLLTAINGAQPTSTPAGINFHHWFDHVESILVVKYTCLDELEGSSRVVDPPEVPHLLQKWLVTMFPLSAWLINVEGVPETSKLAAGIMTLMP